jgi:hypothetical protein
MNARFNTSSASRYEGFVNDAERAARIEALLLKFSQAMTRKAALISEVKAFETKFGEIRAAFGNPYFYSGGSGRIGESVANYTGYNAHEPGVRLVRRVIDVNRELRKLTEELRALTF